MNYLGKVKQIEKRYAKQEETHNKAQHVDLKERRNFYGNKTIINS